MTVYIVDVESVSTRYTGEWKEHLPAQLRQATMEDIVVISGGDTPQATTPGAFLNFGGTNVYKSKQLEQIGELFCSGEIKNGDYFLYTDAWNPTVIQLRYMAELLSVNIKIGGLWHAGSYDPQDFLGRLIGDKPWVRHAEQSMYFCYDHNFFASNFHINMFFEALFYTKFNPARHGADRVVRTGWPMEYLEHNLRRFKGQEKENLILFPHRIAPEKQVEIFRDLAKEMPEYKFVVCQDTELTKNEYHSLLSRAKLVFSANLQETLGISWYEGACVGAIPMVPDRLSYSEMGSDVFKYPSRWTEDFAAYCENKQAVKTRIKGYMENYGRYLPALAKQKEVLAKEFFSGDTMYGTIKGR
jgi:glycosyltransferase involved in cell wall biosynthesis